MGEEILLIKLGAVGDVLRTTAVLAGLKESHPESNITWLTRENAAPLLLNNSLISRVVTLETDMTGLKERYDLVINLDEDEKACAIARTIKGKLIGFYTAAGKICATKTAQEWHRMGLYGPKPENDILKRQNTKTYQQHMAQILGTNSGKEGSDGIVLSLTEEEMNFGKGFAKRNGIMENDIVIGLNTGAGSTWEKKSWSEEYTAKLADKLYSELGAKIVLLGGPAEKERNDRIKKLVNFDIMDSGAGNNLREFASIISQMTLVVSADTLAMHIAVSQKKPVVALFGPTSHSEIELYGRGKKVLPEMDCTCCYKRTCEKKPNCMDMIGVEKVFEAVKGLLR